jgi:hypothetical protein
MIINIKKFNLLILIIFIFGINIISSANIIRNNSTINNCDISTWYIGDSWTYTADPISYNSENGSFNGKIENLKFEVNDKTIISHNDEQIEVYQVDISGEISGEITWGELSGDLEGEIEGISYYRIVDLAEIKTELYSTGIVKILFINRDYELLNINLFFPPLELYDFPIKLNNQWNISCNSATSGFFILEDLVEENFSGSSWLNETINCIAIENISVPAGDFESYKITYTSNTFWYSSEVGNIIKSEVDHNYRDYTFNMDLTLISFNKENQLIEITENINPSEAVIDQEIIISGNVIDSDGHPVQNNEVYVKIPRINKNWETITDNNGYYSIKIFAPYIFDDTPSIDEFGSDGVIVSYIYENFEGYKVKTLLIIANYPPDPPIINGPSNGGINDNLEYRVTAIDPDSDDLNYHIDWGDDSIDEGIIESGETFILSHSWAEEADYTIKAKLIDTYGVESNWTTFDVSIPRNRGSYNYFSFLYERFPILKHLFNFLI